MIIIIKGKPQNLGSRETLIYGREIYYCSTIEEELVRALLEEGHFSVLSPPPLVP